MKVRLRRTRTLSPREGVEGATGQIFSLPPLWTFMNGPDVHSSAPAPVTISPTQFLRQGLLIPRALHNAKRRGISLHSLQERFFVRHPPLLIVRPASKTRLFYRPGRLYTFVSRIPPGFHTDTLSLQDEAMVLVCSNFALCHFPPTTATRPPTPNSHRPHRSAQPGTATGGILPLLLLPQTQLPHTHTKLLFRSTPYPSPSLSYTTDDKRSDSSARSHHPPQQ